MIRERWLAAVFALVLFCCGAAAGALADHYLASNVVNAKTANDFRKHYVAEMRTKLNLTGAQVNQLEGILDNTKKKYKALRDQYRPSMLQIKAEQISEVKSILKPEQIAPYEQLVAEHERRAKDQEERDRREESAHRAQAGR
jgi:hypothetical protein